MIIGGSWRRYELLQWANDWVSARNPGADADEAPKIFSPLTVEFDKAESDRLKADFDSPEPRNSGIFWKRYTLHEYADDDYPGYLTRNTHGDD